MAIKTAADANNPTVKFLTSTEINGYQPTLKDWSLFGCAAPAQEAFKEGLTHRYTTLSGIMFLYSGLLDVVGLVGKVGRPAFSLLQGNASQAAADLANLTVSIARAPISLALGIILTPAGIAVVDPTSVLAEKVRQAVVPGKRALAIIDVQNDFINGSLAVKNGQEVVKPINELSTSLKEKGGVVVITEDFHPPEHGSFASKHQNGKPFTMSKLNGLPQMLWPDHCVQRTPGAQLHSGLKDNADVRVRKGMNEKVDSYSGCYDNGKKSEGLLGWLASIFYHRTGSTGLIEWLRKHDIREVDVAGIATDYCDYYTVLDLLSDGFAVNLIEDACRGVAPDSTVAAIADMRAKGARIITSDQAKAEYAKLQSRKTPAVAA
jgi:nicotinamidase/pyrazinamidase